MGTEETDTPTKASKSSSTQEPPPSSPATVYPDWASFQAYYNTAGTPPIPPPAFFHSSMAANPQGHPPYMWGQHMMPPYGTPPPYVTMYPHGGLYAHPSMPPGSHPYSPYPMISPNGTGEASVAGTGRESDSKSGEGKKKTTLKRSKGSLGSLNMLTSKANEMGKSSGNQNGGISQSGESVGEGSSGGSDANSHNDLKRSGKASADGGDQNGNTTCSVSSGATQTPSNQAMVNPNMVLAVPPNSVSPPTTNLNIGMDYWSGSTSSAVATTRAKLPTVSAGSGKVSSSLAGSHDVVPSDIWMQDERELKRQRRKQSNRESARRSRLRKQAEYDELAQRVEALKGENSSLRDELDHIREECEKLESENARLTESFANQDDSRASGVEDQAECTSQLTTNND